MRVHTMQGAMSLQQADILEAYLNRVSGVTKATVYDRTGDAVICYDGPRETVTKALSSFAYAKEQALAPEHSSRALNRDFEDKLVASLCWRGIKQLFVPSSVRTLITVARSVPYIKAGMTCLMHRKIQVPVLDATAITVSMLRKDFKTASSIMFLLGIGDILDEWTHKKSVADLAQTMSLNVDKVWKETDAGSVLVPVADVQVGDRIVIHTGNVIPLDGKVVSGEAMVNQASITGEPLAVRKAEGGYVYAGTVVEEGDCTICVEKSAGSGRYDRIIRMIEESEKLKSATEDHASHLADQLVPFSLVPRALVWLRTGNMAKALAVRVPEGDDAMPTVMAAVFCFSPREAAVILLRRDMMTAMNTGRMHATTSASRHSMENRMASAPTIVSVEMSRSSGPWWASSVISKRSLVSLLMSWPVRLWSKKLTSSSCTCVKRSRRMSASTRMPNVCPQ